MRSQLRWGVLGAAGIARAQVIPAIQGSANGRVVAVASRDPRRGRDYAGALGIERVVAGYDELLADPDVDAVYIPLPNSLHAEWSVRAAEAGKAVLCEKPLAMSAAEASEVVDACARRATPLMEGFMYRFHPQNRRVLELIAEGAIGEVREVQAHLSVGIMEADPANVRFQPALGGGALLDMGCYAVNVVRRVFGQEPTRVSAFSDIHGQYGVDVATSAVLEFPGGKMGLASCSFVAGGQGRYSVIGTDGVIEVPRAIIPGMDTRVAEGLVVVVDADGRRREEAFDPVDQYRLMAEGFAEAVLSGSPVPFPPQDAVLNMRVLDAAARSARTGCAEHV